MRRLILCVVMMACAVRCDGSAAFCKGVYIPGSWTGDWMATEPVAALPRNEALEALAKLGASHEGGTNDACKIVQAARDVFPGIEAAAITGRCSIKKSRLNANGTGIDGFRFLTSTNRVDDAIWVLALPKDRRVTIHLTPVFGRMEQEMEDLHVAIGSELEAMPWPMDYRAERFWVSRECIKPGMEYIVWMKFDEPRKPVDAYIGLVLAGLDELPTRRSLEGGKEIALTGGGDCCLAALGLYRKLDPKALLRAGIMDSRVDVIDDAIRKGAKTGDDFAVWFAAQYANSEVVEHLLKLGADPKKLNSVTGDSAVHAAASRLGAAATCPSPDCATMIEMLFRAGVDLNVRNEKGDTALFTAAHTGNIVGMRKLVELGADRSVLNRKGLTVLDEMWCTGFEESTFGICRRFLESLGPESKSIAEIYGSCDAQKLLLLGIQHPRTNVIDYALSKGARMDASSAVYKAVLSGAPEIARHLISRGARVRRTSEANGGNHLCVCGLIQTGGSDAKFARMLVVLVKGGSDVNCRGARGETPIMTAARGGVAAADRVRLLAMAGADLLAKNEDGQTVRAILTQWRVGGREDARVVDELIAWLDAAPWAGISVLSRELSLNRIRESHSGVTVFPREAQYRDPYVSRLDTDGERIWTASRLLVFEPGSGEWMRFLPCPVGGDNLQALTFLKTRIYAFSSDALFEYDQAVIGDWTAYGKAEGLVAGKITAIAVDQDDVFVGMSDGSQSTLMVRNKEGRFEPFQKDSMPPGAIGSLVIDKDYVWVGLINRDRPLNSSVMVAKRTSREWCKNVPGYGRVFPGRDGVFVAGVDYCTSFMHLSDGAEVRKVFNATLYVEAIVDDGDKMWVSGRGPRDTDSVAGVYVVDKRTGAVSRVGRMDRVSRVCSMVRVGDCIWGSFLGGLVRIEPDKIVTEPVPSADQ